ncbi:hypothetical protein [Kribbella sp. VKM Ac-2500]|uniref:hypothetical protein n=1 Tax=Kribbella sp. VKM Ac-2500 TaxID=2512214 RepID=UPI001052AA99|nr:hypothetical protein [Kribbella sp. VKM Ac-2500]
MTKLDGFESRLLQALIDIDADGADRRGTSAAGAEQRATNTTNAKRKRRFPSRPHVVAGVAVLILAFGATAAASGLFAPAPPNVTRIFSELPQENGEGVDAAKAVRVGVIDGHVTYAAPTANGGFCLHFAPDPRSGPTGTPCIPRGSHPGEVVFSVLPGSDRGLLFGRAGDKGADTVEIAFPDGAGILTTPIADSGFFAIAIPNAAMQTMMVATTPGPEDPPTQGRRPDHGLRPRPRGRDLGGGLRRGRYPDRFRCPRDGARGRNDRNRARSHSHHACTFSQVLDREPMRPTTTRTPSERMPPDRRFGRAEA